MRQDKVDRHLTNRHNPPIKPTFRCSGCDKFYGDIRKVLNCERSHKGDQKN